MDKTRGRQGKKKTLLGLPTIGRSKTQARKTTKKARRIREEKLRVAEKHRKYNPDTQLLLRNLEAFVESTKRFTNLEPADQQNICTRAREHIVEFQLEQVCMCIIEIARHVEPGHLEDFKWSPAELKDIVLSPVKELQRHTEGGPNGETVCLSPRDTTNFLRGSDELNEIAVTAWNTLLAWGRDEPIFEGSDHGECECSPATILKVDLELEKGNSKKCKHPDRIRSFRAKVERILVDQLKIEVNEKLGNITHNTRSVTELYRHTAFVESREVDMQLLNEEHQYKIAQQRALDTQQHTHEDGRQIAVEEQSTGVSVDSTITRPMEGQPTLSLGPLSAAKPKYRDATSKSVLNRHNNTHSTLHTNGPTRSGKSHAAATLGAVHKVEDLDTFFKNEMQTRIVNLQAEMTDKMNSWMEDKERQYVSETRSYMESIIAQAMEGQSHINQNYSHRLSAIESSKNDNCEKLGPAVTYLKHELEDLKINHGPLASDVGEMKESYNKIALYIEQLGTSLQQVREKLDTFAAGFVQPTQVDIYQQQRGNTVTDLIHQAVVQNVMSFMGPMCDRVQTDLKAQQDETAKLRNETNERISEAMKRDGDNYIGFKVMMEKENNRIDAEIRSLIRAVNSKEKELTNWLKSVEEKHNTINGSLDAHSNEFQQLQTSVQQLQISMHSMSKTQVDQRREVEICIQKSEGFVKTVDSIIATQVAKTDAMSGRFDHLQNENATVNHSVQTRLNEIENSIQVLNNNSTSILITSELQNQLSDLQPLRKDTEELAKSVETLDAKVEDQNKQIERIVKHSETDFLKTENNIKGLKTATKELEESIMIRLANFEKAKQATWRTLYAHSSRTRRAGEKLIALQSEAEAVKSLAWIDGLAKESAKVDLFIQKAQKSLDDTTVKFGRPSIEAQDELQGLIETLKKTHNEIKNNLETFDNKIALQSSQTETQLQVLESRMSTVELSLRNEDVMKTPRLQALEAETERTKSRLTLLEGSSKASTPKTNEDQTRWKEIEQLGRQQEDLYRDLTDLRTTLTDKETLQTMHNKLNRTLEVVKRDVEKLKEDTRIQEEEMQTLQRSLKCAELDGKRMFQSQITAFERLSKKLQRQIATTTCHVKGIENTKHSVPTTDKVQVQDSKAKGLESQTRASSDMWDEPSDASSLAGQRPKCEWEAAERKRPQERSLYEVGNTLQDLTRSVGYLQNQLDNLLRTKAEDTDHISKIRTEIRAEWATVKKDLESQLHAKAKSLGILDDYTKSLKTKKQDSEVNPRISKAENQSSCHNQEPKTGSCHQVKSGNTKTQESVTNECFELPNSTAWIFQQLKAKDNEISRLIEYYENRRLTHFAKCKAYAEQKRAQTELLKDQIRQLEKRLNDATHEIQRRDKYIATISEAKVAHHGNDGLGWNGDNLKEQNATPDLTRETIDRNSQSEKPYPAAKILTTGPQVEENATGASGTNRVRPNKRGIGRTNEKPQTYNLRNKTKPSPVPNSLSTSLCIPPQKMAQPVRLDPLKGIPALDVNVDYLQPGFDPQSLTIPKLRSILVRHEIKYASNSNKKVLLDLFKSEIEPRASVTLEHRAKVKRSAEGIVDVIP